MHDLASELREYVDTFDTPFDPDAIIQKAEQVSATPLEPRPSIRRGLVVALAAAVSVLGLVGGVLVVAGLLGNGETPVVTQVPQVTTVPPTPTTTPPVTTTLAPDTTLPPPHASPAELAGRWTVYSSEQGLPTGGTAGVAIALDGTAWAAQLGSDGTLYRLDGTQWSQVGEPIGVSYWQWMITTPDGGVAMAVPGGSIVHFDGDQWLDQDNYHLDFSAVVAGPRILGYSDSGDLVDIRFVDGGFAVKSASRGANGGSRPSLISISHTVDVDSEGIAWFGTVEGAWRFDGDSLELIEFGVQGDCCAPLAVDVHDNTWISIDTGALFRIARDGEIVRFSATDGIPFLGNILKIIPTADGTVWLLEHGGGYPGSVAHFDGNTWTSYGASEAQEAGLPTMASGSGFGVVEGQDGSTWTVQLLVGNEPEVHRFFDGQWKTVSTVGISWGEVGADYGTLGMAVGPDGSLWIPTSIGVARFQPTGE